MPCRYFLHPSLILPFSVTLPDNQAQIRKMKKTVLFSFFCFLLAMMANAQRSNFIPEHDQLMIVVDTFVTDVKHLLLDPDKIESLDIRKGENAVSAYGEKAKNGILVIHLKKNAQILRFEQLLEQYNISTTDRTLHVCINNVQVGDTKKLLIEKDNIASVEVVTDTRWITPAIPGPEERYINILTRKEKK
jgi:hypothetical protein